MKRPKLSLSKQNRLLEYIRKNGTCRARELGAKGFNPAQVHRLEQQGLITRVGYGLYSAFAEDLVEHKDLIVVARRMSSHAICLLSALQFHGMTDESPFEVWVAIDTRAREPVINFPPVRFIRMSKKTIEEGVEEHVISGVIVRVFNPAKTVADCFKYRSTVGLDVAINALKDCLQKKLAARDEIWHYSKICRVNSIIRPYLESLS